MLLFYLQMGGMNNPRMPGNLINQQPSQQQQQSIQSPHMPNAPSPMGGGYHHMNSPMSHPPQGISPAPMGGQGQHTANSNASNGSNLSQQQQQQHQPPNAAKDDFNLDFLDSIPNT